MKISLPVVITKKLIGQCILLILCGFLYEVVTDFFILSLTSRQTIPAIIFSILCPFLTLASYHWFVETNNFKERVILTAATGCGYGIGTFVVLLIFK